MRARIVGDAILVDDDTCVTQPFFHFSPGEICVSVLQVNQQQVVVCAARTEPEAVTGQAFASRFGVGNDLGLILAEGRPRASPNAWALAAMTCINGPPWDPGNTFRSIFFAISSSLLKIKPPRGPRRVLWVVVVTTSAWGNGEGEPRRPRVRRCGRCRPSDTPTCRRSHGIGEVDHTGIRAEAANDQLGFAFQGSLPDMVHVEQFGVGIQDVIVNFKECSREVWLQAVRQVSTVRDGQTQDTVAGLKQGHKSRDVCVGAAVWLHVCKLTAEQFLRSITSKVFDLIVEFTTAVVPLADSLPRTCWSAKIQWLPSRPWRCDFHWQ